MGRWVGGEFDGWVGGCLGCGCMHVEIVDGCVFVWARKLGDRSRTQVLVLLEVDLC